jgi:NadR type nicotinamide-nucleotide adenylyltransferase
MRKVGLTLGKFAPLHRGHQFVIETALSEMDAVKVILYDSPEVTAVPLPVRAAWIRALYPSVEVIEAWDGPSEVGSDPRLQKLHEDYIIHELGVRGVTHFYSSEFYGEHISRALGAVNRVVDAGRTAFPVSGTAARQDPYKHRAFLHPLVYRDLVTRVVFLGAPSTGKTTLAAAMASACGTVWMPEYGRDYWEAHQSERRLTPEQLVEIAEEHRAREERLVWDADGYLFTDTNAWTTYIFALAYHGFALPRLAEMAAEEAARYDLVFVCGDEIPYANTWDRSGEGNRRVFQKRILADLAVRRVPYFVVRGSVEERVWFVQQTLAKHPKWSNLLAPP